MVIVIIFDWDDTLLASSFLSSRGYRLDSEMEVTTFAVLHDTYDDVIMHGSMIIMQWYSLQ
jgi:hypothetical protein